MPDQNIHGILSLQDEIFKIIYPIIPNTALLSGGTALTRFYGLTHRFSEDIDIFFYKPKEEHSSATLEKIKNWLYALKTGGFSIEETAYEPGGDKLLFNLMAIASKGNNIIRIDFVDDVFSGCWLPVKMKTVDTNIEFNLDSIEAILHKKLYALYNSIMLGKPPRAKDLIDVYVLFKEKFVFDEVKDFYLNARDIILPFESIINAVSSANPDFSEILNLDKKVESGFKAWQTTLTSK